MESQLILNEGRQADGRDLLEARKMTFRKMNNAFLFNLDDNQYFFISFHYCSRTNQDRRDKIVIRPNIHILNQIVRTADNDSLKEYLVIDISGHEEISMMHLVDAVIIVLKDLEIHLKYAFEAFSFKIIQDSKNTKFVLDSDIESQKEAILVKAGRSDLFLMEAFGEIEAELLKEIVQSCFDS
ncbi:hypothetical protein M153_2800006986 [Pseudoloma neurophilia]|uniref:Uncharacterized protein n=1 Tax=Pseudoloma neurophilia TaxID=146866 RepID=A0A0R0LZ35_9MICR|nr:hypothetical protein M153_2800006986 [Pseudoloma neurophilia]